METVSFQHDILPLKDMLFRLALRITLNRQDAEDVVQETLIRCWNKRDSWQEIDSIQAFATTVCRNLALDTTKRASRKTVSMETDNGQTREGVEHQTTDSALDQMLHNERVEMLKKMVDKLPEKQKLCLQLRDFEEKSYKEISELLDLPEPQVKVNLFRARQTLKKLLTS